MTSGTVSIDTETGGKGPAKGTKSWNFVVWEEDKALSTS
jgi:hypothetical protein